MEQQNVNINIDPDKVESKYSDTIFIGVNPFGFNLDFGQQLPQANTIKIVTRVSISPQHAKIFSNILQQNIKMYEEKFGDIKVNVEMQKEVQRSQEIGFKLEKEDK